MVALMGPVAEVTAMTQIAVPQRPSPEGPRAVENEDSALALIRTTASARRSVSPRSIRCRTSVLRAGAVTTFFAGHP